MIQISKLKGNKKQAKYDQKVITVLKIKTKTNTKTTKTKKNIKNNPKSKDKNNESRRLQMRQSSIQIYIDKL